MFHYREAIQDFARNGQAFPEWTLDEWSQIVDTWAESKGWNERPIPFEEVIALLHTELSEAYEEFRKHNEIEVYFELDEQGIPKPEGVPIEIADELIRIFHYAARYGWPLQQLVALKMVYNETRSYRHGGKKS